MILFDDGHDSKRTLGIRDKQILCYRCNKLQGTDSWATFLKKQGVVDQKTQIKKSLQVLTLGQLKTLATKHKIRVTGKIEETFSL